MLPRHHRQNLSPGQWAFIMKEINTTEINDKLVRGLLRLSHRLDWIHSHPIAGSVF